jgi:tRNA(fMet)-specific endonuclease VapC
MPAYLFDANILSDFMRNPFGRAFRIFEQKMSEPETRLFTSIIVACEMRYGAAKKGSASLTKRVDKVLASLEVAPLSVGADDTYAILRADLEHRGQLIGQNDMLIAAHALALNAILVTDNVREFKRIKSLKIENWLRT